MTSMTGLRRSGPAHAAGAECRTMASALTRIRREFCNVHPPNKIGAAAPASYLISRPRKQLSSPTTKFHNRQGLEPNTFDEPYRFVKFFDTGSGWKSVRYVYCASV